MILAVARPKRNRPPPYRAAGPVVRLSSFSSSADACPEGGRRSSSKVRAVGKEASQPNRIAVAEAIPDSIVLKRHRDLVGRRHDIWLRRGLLVLIGVVP